jgi:hypothetical protein
MKRAIIYLALTVFLLSGFSACTSYNYYTAAINKTNMSGYRTFAWMPPSRSNDNTSMGNSADLRIKDAVTSALVAKGLQLSQRRPDLIIKYSTKVGLGSYTTYYSPNYYGGFIPAGGLVTAGVGDTVLTMLLALRLLTTAI